MSETQQGMKIEPERLRNFCEEVLVGAGVPREDARIVSTSLVDADLAGVGCHGVTWMND